MVAGDPVMLGEAVDNLIDNAMRYGTSGTGGRIVISLEGRTGTASSEVILSVWDDGPGIPESAGEIIFERFARLREDGGAGCGLGLPIVRAVAERHGGTARLMPQDERGGTSFEIPPAAGANPGSVIRCDPGQSDATSQIDRHAVQNGA